jgi:hypothetical protein
LAKAIIGFGKDLWGMTFDDALKILVPASSALLGGLLVAVANHMFTRRRTDAETKKLVAEAEKTRAETQQILAGMTTIVSTVQEVSSKLGPTNETVIYNGTAADGADFSGQGERFFGDSKDKPKGAGILKVESGILNVQRTNVEARFRITLLTYAYGGATRDYLPKNELLANRRILKVTCEVKVVGGAHTALFIIKKKAGGDWLASQEHTFATNEWMAVEVYFRVPPGDDCYLVIDDQRVSKPNTSLQLRRLILVERG